jgi:hypothetical protein
MGEALTAVGGLVAGVLLVGVVQLFTVMIRQKELDDVGRRIEQENQRVESALRIVAATGMTYQEARAARDSEGSTDEH